jgi:multidrug efflux system membrane fusion protein
MSWIEQLSQVDTEGVEPMTSVVAVKLPLREDVVTEGGDRLQDGMAVQLPGAPGARGPRGGASGPRGAASGPRGGASAPQAGAEGEAGQRRQRPVQTP